MLDLIITGDRVVSPQGVEALDIGVKDGLIAMVAPRGGLASMEAGRRIDATGQIVMPGGIDPHVHCAWPIPSRDGASHILSDGPDVVSRAALHGGTTTLIDFATWTPGGTIAEAVEARDAQWTGQCHCDYAYHLMLQGEVPQTVLTELGQFIDAGYATVKIFTTDITPSRRGRMIRFGDIWEIFKVVTAHGGLAVIHAEDNDIVMHMYDKLIAADRVKFEHMAEVHNALSEELSFRRIIRLAENVPGTALYMMHVSAASGVEAIEESRARGFPIYGETLHQYLMFSSDDYRRVNGQIYHTYPSLKSKADQDALWNGMTRGTIHSVATDEICCTLEVKTQGERIDDTTGGNAGVEPRLAVMYTQMVEQRGWSLERFVDLTSTNAAKVMGLYPRKGVIAPGSEADITLLDPGRRRTVDRNDLHETDYSPWEGHDVAAWPSMTIFRGKVVVEDGAFAGSTDDGRYLNRFVAESVRESTELVGVTRADGKRLNEAGIEHAGQVLWAAWCAHEQLEALTEGSHPQSVDDGYAIQSALVRASGLATVGWKVGATNRTAQAMLSLDGPVSGRLLGPFCFDSPAEIPASEFAMRALEPEIALTLGVDIPPRDRPYQSGELMATVASVHPALEIPDTRLARWETVGAPAFIADNSVAGRFVLGASAPDWRLLDLAALDARLIVDGEVAAEGKGGDALGGPFEVLAWLANHAAARGLTLRAGEVVTTGTCSPIRFAAPGSEVVADFGELGSASVRFVA